MKKFLSLLLVLALAFGMFAFSADAAPALAAEDGTIRIYLGYIGTGYNVVKRIKNGDTLVMYEGENLRTDIPLDNRIQKKVSNSKICSLGTPDTMAVHIFAHKEGKTTVEIIESEYYNYDIKFNVTVLPASTAQDVCDNIFISDQQSYLKMGKDGNIYHFVVRKIKNKNSKKIYVKGAGAYDDDTKWFKVKPGKTKKVYFVHGSYTVDNAASSFHLSKSKVEKLKAGKKVKVNSIEDQYMFKYGDLYIPVSYFDW